MPVLSRRINDLYDALMFAKSPQAARHAAEELVRVVLGEKAHNKPLEEALRECCRILRPAADPNEQARYEAEFIELAMWPSGSEKMAA
jgi:ribosomal 50S subunit-associated protein YjgA (DUF615 family)